MSWTNVKLIFLRELKDQLRDRRTIFTIAVLPLLLYPLLAMIVFQVQQFRKENPSRVQIVGASDLAPLPRLLADGHFAPELCSQAERRLLVLDIDETPPNRLPSSEVAARARRDLQAGRFDAVVYFPPDFARELQRFREKQADSAAADAPPAAPEPQIFLSTASDKSRVARDRLWSVLNEWRTSIVQDTLRQNDLPLAAAMPFEVNNQDVAEETGKRAVIWSKVLPFVLLVWALTGAFYPAIDLCAGEKERGTLETLLSSPAQRSEIVWGKLLTVMTFSMVTSLLNLASMGITGTFILTQLQKIASSPLPVEVGPPPLIAVVWLVMALVPVSAMFSALSLAIAAFARSSKEGQYYLMPLLMVSLPLMTLPMLPGSQLDVGSSLIPLTGVVLLLKSLIEGQYWEAIKHFPLVTAVTASCCLLAIRWAVDQFNNEAVLFRENERFTVSLWVRHLLRDREDTPSVGEALFCGVLLLVIRFFANFLLPVPTHWSGFVQTTLVLQIALIATPACLMAIMLTRRPLAALAVRAPTFLSTVPAAALLAIFLHPAITWLSIAIRALYPLGDDVLAQLKPLDTMLQNAPLWQAVLLIGLTPAICEELAFRGFILSGLRHIGHRWIAIAMTAALFGIAHGLLQQSLSAFVVGLVIGYVAVKTNSIWPAMVFHMVHNSLMVLLTHVSRSDVSEHPLLSRLLVPASEAFGPWTWLARWIGESLQSEQLVYHPVAVALMLAGAGVVVLWLRRLPSHASAEERLQEALDHQTPAPYSAKAS
ncbi:MAG TPA: ABC transporter permease subunit/CPBP intramembrane protease [Pirellulaceae bacterium]|nr:ABC transporter permease subunit/CPBP intramembrane protease [Pirellulaceae bacterium]